jgi:hypothetical protein
MHSPRAYIGLYVTLGVWYTNIQPKALEPDILYTELDFVRAGKSSTKIQQY